MIGYLSSTAFIIIVVLVSIVSGHGLSIDMCHRNQPNKS